MNEESAKTSCLLVDIRRQRQGVLSLSRFLFSTSAAALLCHEGFDNLLSLN